MKKFLFSTSIVLLLLLFTGQLLFADKNLAPTGTIRGGTYLDADGDGHCTDSDTPIPNIDISFNSGTDTLTLYSGTNGTYGLPTAGQGTWTVTVLPNANEWQVTSSPSQQATVSAQDLVQLNINFCLRPAVGGSGTGTPNKPAPLPAEDIIAVLQEQIESTATTTLTPQEVTSAISVALLTNPPEPDPHPFADTFADIPVQLAPEEEWLAYLNLFREMSLLPHLTAEENLSEGSQLHSRYMVMLDEPISHKENPNKDLFTPPGNTAAHNSDIFATSQVEANYKWAINFWMSAPFHQVPLIDPELTSVGYGNYNKEIGTFNMAAVIDVLSHDGNPDPAINYPIYFPAQDSETWIVRHSMYEWPDPLTNCAGYTRPTGPPIVLQLGDGSKTPNVTSHKVSIGDLVLDTCLIHESNYVNPDPFAQTTGRTILGDRDAIVIMPRIPLEKEQTYNVEITADGHTYNWSFKTSQPPTSPNE